MKQIFQKWTALALTTLATLTVAPAALAEESALFSDDFDQDTSAAWTVLTASDVEGRVHDYTVEFSRDYSQDTYVFAGSTNPIPSAPHSADGTTRGVKITVDKTNEVAELVAVNLLPKNASFSGNYALRVDLWLNYPGGPFGTPVKDTTNILPARVEFAMFGLNLTGNRVACDLASRRTDGLWFAVDAQAGSSRDYRAYEGSLPTFGDPELRGFAGGFLDRNDDGIAEANVRDDPDDENSAQLAALFPAPEFETPGIPSKKWVEVEVRLVDGLLTWTFDGKILAQRLNLTSFTAGKIMLGYFNANTLPEAPKNQNFVLFDNVRVVQFPPSEVPPAAPTDLTATTVSLSQIDLTWTDNAHNETGFTVERSTDGLSFFTVASLVAATTAYADTLLTAEMTYYYRVSAANDTGTSAPSQVASATTTTEAPPAENLTITRLPAGQLQLNFTAQGQASQYHVVTVTDLAQTWTDAPDAVVESVGSGQFKAVLTDPSGLARFYRVRW